MGEVSLLAIRAVLLGKNIFKKIKKKFALENTK